MNSEMNSMGESSLVSVIVPVYNVRPYLEEALDSAVHQTYRNLEIIVVDDGSNDGSGEICDRYAEKDSRIRVIHQKNQGLSAARNAGLDIMHGEYVAFLDSDDAFLPEMIEKLLSAMKREPAEMAICNYSNCYSEHQLNQAEGKKTEIFVEAGIYDQESFFDIIVNQQVRAYVWNKLYQADVWNGLRFPIGHVYEDIAVIWPIALRIRKLIIIPEVLYLYRQRRGSITLTESADNYRDWLSADHMYCSFVEQHTPSLFSEEQLLISYQIALEQHLYNFSRKKMDEMPLEDITMIKARILYLGHQTKGHGRGLRVWLGWQLFRCSPWLMRKIYAIYYAMYVKRLEKS